MPRRKLTIVYAELVKVVVVIVHTCKHRKTGNESLQLGNWSATSVLCATNESQRTQAAHTLNLPGQISSCRQWQAKGA